MSSDVGFPFVDVPEDAKKFLGQPLPGTRLYTIEGSHDDSDIWAATIFQLYDSALSPGGVAQRVGVARASVHYRLREGLLTGFFFYPVKTRIPLHRNADVRGKPYIYIPSCEANAWRVELEKKALKTGKISTDDLEGPSSELLEDFFEWRSKWMKEKLNQMNKG